MKNPKAEPGKEEYVVPEVIRLKGFDLRTRELAVAFGLRIVEGVKPELYDSSNPVSDRAVVLASKLGTVELDGFKNSLESRLPDVSFANPDNPASKEPYGTYVVAEGSDVYQLSVGGKKSIDAFIVEKSKFRANGSVSASKVLIKDADIRIAHEAGSIATQNLVVEGSSKISLVDEDTDEKKKSLTTILGANLTKDSVDTFKIGKGSEVWANVKDYEEGTVGGTLISNKIGSPAKQINKLDLKQGAFLGIYSIDGKAIYGSEKLDMLIGNGVTVIHNVKGFNKIVLDGGLLEGDLTGSQPNVGGKKNPFEGSVEMKSGTYQGGKVTKVESITISGPVRLMPGVVTELKKMNDDGTVQSTKAKSIDMHSDIAVTNAAIVEISKAGDLKKGESHVNVKGSMTFQKGSGLAVVVDDMTADRVGLNTAYLNIKEDGSGKGTLKLEGDNRVHIRPRNLMEPGAYEATKQLYKAAKDGSAAPIPMTIVSFKTTDGTFEEPVSEYPLLNVASIKKGSPGYDDKSYKVSLTFNKDPRGTFRSMWNMSHNDAEVASAALLSSLEAGGEAGKAMFNAIQESGYQKIAREHKWEPHAGMGMAAVTVTQKTNQSISRHLNRHRIGIATGDMFESRGFWGEYFFSEGEMDDTRDVCGFENTVNGINLGFDALLNNQLTAGFAFTYGDVKTKTNKLGQEASGDTYMATVYTGWTMDDYFFDTMWTYGRGSLDMKRKTSQGNYKSDTRSETLAIRLVGGYNYQVNQWLIQPQVEFNYAKVKFDDFREKPRDGEFAQSVKMNDFEVMELGAGFKLIAEYDVSNGMLRPEFTLMGYHDFKDKKPEVRGIFLTGHEAYHVIGKNRNHNRVLSGVGLKYEMNNDLTLGLNYGYNWQGDYTAHGVVVSVRYDF
ncbi:autotransporter outer membrane beta-barrel domain-containing protein [Endozoicomonas lisbonensis]